MLNKEICKKCSSQWRIDCNFPPEVNFEESWDMGNVFCHKTFDIQGHRDIMRSPPENCTYYLEQTIIELNKER